MKRSDGPLLVYGPRSASYDFGPSHPLTPRRFGPAIDLLASVGAEPGLAPEPAPEGDLALCHAREYIAEVRRFSEDPLGPPAAGIGWGGDNPAFAGMHDAAAMVAGGSLRAIEAILRGDVEHAFHPGGGLHHAMRERASGFCIYNDPALAIARARRDGLRVLYVDLDVHHGDGVEALFRDDPGVLTISFHEDGRYLFPGSGAAGDVGRGNAAGTIVNVPFEPHAGDAAWLPAVRSIVPPLAAAFGPDLVVSQHGADSHAWDPLAHLRVTTTAMGAAARILDAIAHRHARGRWLSTGGGGYDAYRVVPRSWSLVWLAGAHRDAPGLTPAPWRDRWAQEAARHGQTPLPESFTDEPNVGERVDTRHQAADEASASVTAAVRETLVPGLLRAAEKRGWWSPDDAVPSEVAPGTGPGGAPVVIDLDAVTLDRLRLAPRVIPPANPSSGRALVGRALTSGAKGTAAVVDGVVVGLGIVADGELLGLGVAPAYRRAGLGGALLRRLAGDGELQATITVAERDPVEPLGGSLRASIARRLLERAGFEVRSEGGAIGRIDAAALVARLRTPR